MKKIHDTLKTVNDNSLAYIYNYSSKNKYNLIWFGGLNSDMHGTKAEAISEYADLNNYNFCRFDYSGHGLSSGSFEDFNISDWLNDSINISLLLTGAIGIASEGGEFSEIVKKVTFQGKPMDEDTKFHMKRELGDIMWYWINSCRALDLDPNDVIAENVEKLKARYPGGAFDVHYSENRKEGDL